MRGGQVRRPGDRGRFRAHSLDDTCDEPAGADADLYPAAAARVH
ncbi:hypothetical protein MSP7336_02348 [Mycobacterium shimoidei]|uniref:Uncharacterized protein n=1 Tax=Mycobacterium shimoidei TaxID=29313 RepID=A0A375YZJ6_MYCSH|nr:hypothetical protein MSP7336_02348 [Mycobacterium shimoidei]